MGMRSFAPSSMDTAVACGKHVIAAYMEALYDRMLSINPLLSGDVGATRSLVNSKCSRRGCWQTNPILERLSLLRT